MQLRYSAMELAAEMWKKKKENISTSPGGSSEHFVARIWVPPYLVVPTILPPPLETPRVSEPAQLNIHCVRRVTYIDGEEDDAAYIGGSMISLWADHRL